MIPNILLLAVVGLMPGLNADLEAVLHVLGVLKHARSAHFTAIPIKVRFAGVDQTVSTVRQYG